jgi:hypothetical protein
MVAGAAGTAYASKKIRRTAEALKPANVAKAAVGKVKDKAHDLVEAVREGRDAMHEKEAELKARRDGVFDDAAAPQAPAQVIVLAPVAPRQRSIGPRRRRA